MIGGFSFIALGSRSSSKNTVNNAGSDHLSRSCRVTVKVEILHGEALVHARTPSAVGESVSGIMCRTGISGSQMTGVFALMSYWHMALSCPPTTTSSGASSSGCSTFSSAFDSY